MNCRYVVSIFVALGLLPLNASGQDRKPWWKWSPPKGSLIAALRHAQPRVPVCDLTAYLDISDPENLRFKGSFRLLEKENFEFDAIRPRFFYTADDPRSDYFADESGSPSGEYDIKVRGQNWASISTAPDNVFVTVPSDTSSTPYTPAIIEFDIPIDPEHSAEFDPRGFAVTLDGVFRLNDGVNTISRDETSFAICSLPGRGRKPIGEAGLDTNSIIPIGLQLGPKEKSRFEIGQGESFWTYSPFLTWKGHWNLDSRPRMYSYIGFADPASDTNWFALPWFDSVSSNDPNTPVISLFGSTASYIFSERDAEPDIAKRKTSVGYMLSGELLMIYSPDITDMEARKFFQISGVILYRHPQ